METNNEGYRLHGGGEGEEEDARECPNNTCPFELSSNLGLLERSHLETVEERTCHIGIKLVKCSTCSKSFYVKDPPKMRQPVEKGEYDQYCPDCNYCDMDASHGETITPGMVRRRMFYRYFISWFVIIYGYVTRSFGAFMAVASIALLMSVNNQVPSYIQQMMYVPAGSSSSGSASRAGNSTGATVPASVVTGKDIQTDLINWLIYGGILIGVGFVMLLLWGLEWFVYQRRILKRQLKRQRYTFLEKQITNVNPYAYSYEYDYWSAEEDNKALSDPDCAHLNFLLGEANGTSTVRGRRRRGGGGGAKQRQQSIGSRISQTFRRATSWRPGQSAQTTKIDLGPLGGQLAQDRGAGSSDPEDSGYFERHPGETSFQPPSFNGRGRRRGSSRLPVVVA